MSILPPVPLFVGPVEMLLIGAVILVIIFGSRATDVAREAGSTVGKVRKSRQAVEEEIDEVKGEFQEGIEPVKEEVEAVEEDIEAVEEDLDPGSSSSDIDRPERSKPGEDDDRL
jgi:Sec-independent protein translocase protein TatA